jgi:preprotein translocase subunit SecG
VTVILVILYIIVCLFLILVVLLQQGKGADLAGAFGGGGSQTSFGPRGTTNIMHRLTTGVFVLFVLLSITLAILSGKRHSSVMEDLAAAEQAPVAVEEAGGASLDASEGIDVVVDIGDDAAPTESEPVADQ